MSRIFDSMTLILPQIKFEAILSKNVGGVAFQAEADVLHQILRIFRYNFSLVAHMAPIWKFWTSSEEIFPINLYFCPPLIYASQVRAKCMKLPPAPLRTHFTSQAS